MCIRGFLCLSETDPFYQKGCVERQKPAFVIYTVHYSLVKFFIFLRLLICWGQRAGTHATLLEYTGLIRQGLNPFGPSDHLPRAQQRLLIHHQVNNYTHKLTI